MHFAKSAAAARRDGSAAPPSPEDAAPLETTLTGTRRLGARHSHFAVVGDDLGKSALFKPEGSKEPGVST